jgi:hypothetical protein
VQRCGQVEALTAGGGVDGPHLGDGGAAPAGAAVAVAVGLAAAGPAVGAAVALAVAVDGRGVAVGLPGLRNEPGGEHFASDGDAVLGTSNKPVPLVSSGDTTYSSRIIRPPPKTRGIVSRKKVDVTNRCVYLVDQRPLTFTRPIAKLRKPQEATSQSGTQCEKR